MKREWGFTFIKLLIVVTIIGALSAIAIPIYRDKVRRSKVQEAVDTIDAIKDEISSYVSNEGSLPPPCNNHNQILNILGVQVPDNGKWQYWIRSNGVIFVRARAPLGQSLRGGWIRCTPQVDMGIRVITQWQWRCDGTRVKPGYLPQ